jgi:3-hydroxyacyl-CoA dehydrogenase
MKYNIHRAVVIGSGTMGAAIAAHLANAGVPVTLLDIVPGKLTPEEQNKGLTLQDPGVRNRIVQQGLERAAKSRPASFFSQAFQSLVRVGNLEDNLDVVSQADWVIEAIVENLDIKRQLMVRLDACRSPHTIVSTSGIHRRGTLGRISKAFPGDALLQSAPLFEAVGGDSHPGYASGCTEGD